MRTGGRDHPSRLERCSPSAGVDVGNAVGSTASVAQPQRGIEWPAAAAWASLLAVTIVLRYHYLVLRIALRTSVPVSIALVVIDLVLSLLLVAVFA